MPRSNPHPFKQGDLVRFQSKDCLPAMAELDRDYLVNYVPEGSEWVSLMNVFGEIHWTSLKFKPDPIDTLLEAMRR